MRMRFMTLEDATLAGASMTDLGRDLELEVDPDDRLPCHLYDEDE
ncbi:hypothetical protein ACIGW8_06185 [Streptomyces sioyaensis]